MKRIYHNYLDWEDFNNGMYCGVIRDYEVKKSIELLSNHLLFDKVCASVTKHWPVSTDENLSNIHCNRRAWIGQAACSYNSKSSEVSTRKAWSLLSDYDRYNANKIADKHIRIYERKNSKIHKTMGRLLL